MSAATSPRGALAGWFAVLCVASVSMTIGNKALMMSEGGVLTQHTHLVVLLQNLVAVVTLGVPAALGAVDVKGIDGRQLAFYSWDALVLVVQLWTSFEALHFLPVSAITVVRALAIPLVAWCERIFLGTRLSGAQHACSWIVVVGAATYAHRDLSHAGHPRQGYLWACANLVAYASNSLLDRVMMSSTSQTAAGITLITQAISLPISYGQGRLVHGLGLASIASLVGSLDAPTAAALLVTGVGAGALGSCFAQCYKRASATAVTIAGNVNKACSVLVSVAVFGTEISATQLVGLVCCLGGAFGYSFVGARARDGRAAARGGGPAAGSAGSRQLRPRKAKSKPA